MPLFFVGLLTDGSSAPRITLISVAALRRVIKKSKQVRHKAMNGAIPFNCAVLAVHDNSLIHWCCRWSFHVPKSRFSRILTIKTPGMFSSASGFSLIGFHLSVPGIRPCHHWTSRMDSVYETMESAKLTKIAMRAFDDRCTTNSNEIIKLTTTPTSTSQMIENTNVKVIRLRSTHAPILIKIHSFRTRLIEQGKLSHFQKYDISGGTSTRRENTTRQMLQRSSEPKARKLIIVNHKRTWRLGHISEESKARATGRIWRAKWWWSIQEMPLGFDHQRRHWFETWL